MSKKNGRQEPKPAKPVAPERSEQDVYAEIVADEKAKARAAAEQGTNLTGDQVSKAIAKRWAKVKGRSFDDAEPDDVDAVPPAGVKPKLPLEEHEATD